MSVRNATTVISNYRYILKHLQSLPSGGASNNTTNNLRSQCMQLFRTGKHESNDKQAAVLREVAYSYVTMASSVKQLTYLRELDTGEKLNPRDKVRATAGRVGLSVPMVCLLHITSNFDSSCCVFASFSPLIPLLLAC